MVQLNESEFQRLSDQNLPKPELWRRLLERLVSATGANAAVLWNCEQAPYQPVSQLSRGPTIPLPLSEADHSDILKRVLQQQQSAIVRPPCDESKRDSLVIYLAPVDRQRDELIELVLDTTQESSNDQRVMSMVNQACNIVATLGKSAGPSDPAVATPTVESLSQYVHVVHQSLDQQQTCTAIANESRRILDCDRVSVVLRRRGQFKIIAISGQPSVNRRSNTVGLLEKLAQRTLATKREFWYPTSENQPTPIESALEPYVNVSATRSLVIHPIQQEPNNPDNDPELERRSNNVVIGGIIYEHFHQLWERESVSPSFDFVTEHAGMALRNARQHQGLFLFPVWNLLSKSRVLMAPRALPKSLLAIGATIGLIMFLCLYQVPFYISAQGVLVPSDQTWVFAQSQGRVESVNVSHGDRVEKGQSLVSLRNEELGIQMSDTRGRINVLKQRRREIESQKFRNSVTENNRPLAGYNLSSIKAELQALENKLDLLKRLSAQTEIESPIGGQIMTWDIRNKLANRTLMPGQQILEIADVDGPWHLELDVEDRRIGHLQTGAFHSDSPLKVQFTLASDPDRSYEGTVVQIDNVMQLTNNHQQVLRVRVAIDHQHIALKKARSGVTAKIYCGNQTSLGYLWLHDVSETLNRYVLFYFAG